MSLRLRPQGARRESHAQRKRRTESSGAINEKPVVTHGYVRAEDGTKLFYSIEGKGKPLVFCYGLVCSSLHWTYQIEHFSRNHRAIWMDYRGHGNSEVPRDLKSLTVATLAGDLGIVLDELDVQDAVFLGHSMGVNVVLEFYRRQPHRVAGMVLANGTAKRPLDSIFRSNLLDSGFELLKKVHSKSPSLVEHLWRLQRNNPLARSIVALSGFNPHLTPRDDIQLYVQQVAEMDPSILIHLIEDYHRSDESSWLHRIVAPTLIIAGEQDKVTPLESQELLRQLIPGSRLELIRHGSHCPQMDLPDLVNLKIERFLEEIRYDSEPTQTREIASQPTGSHPVAAP